MYAPSYHSLSILLFSVFSFWANHLRKKFQAIHCPLTSLLFHALISSSSFPPLNMLYTHAYCSKWWCFQYRQSSNYLPVFDNGIQKIEYWRTYFNIAVLTEDPDQQSHKLLYSEIQPKVLFSFQQSQPNSLVTFSICLRKSIWTFISGSSSIHPVHLPKYQARKENIILTFLKFFPFSIPRSLLATTSSLSCISICFSEKSMFNADRQCSFLIASSTEFYACNRAFRIKQISSLSHCGLPGSNLSRFDERYPIVHSSLISMYQDADCAEDQIWVMNIKLHCVEPFQILPEKFSHFHCDDDKLFSICSPLAIPSSVPFHLFVNFVPLSLDPSSSRCSCWIHPFYFKRLSASEMGSTLSRKEKAHAWQRN